MRGFLSRWKDHINSSATEFILFAIHLGGGIITARALGPDGKGALTAVLLWPGFLTGIISGGMEHGVIYFGARYRGAIGQFLEFARNSALALGVFVAALGCVFVVLRLDSLEESMQQLSILYFILSPLLLYSSMMLNLLRASRQLTLWNQLRMGPQCVIVILLIGLWSSGSLEAEIACLLYMFIPFVSFLPAYLRLRTLMRAEEEQTLPVYRLIGSYALRNAAGGWSGKINNSADQALISLWLKQSDLGVYRVAVSAASGLRMVSLGIQRLLLVEAAEQQPFSKRKRLILQRFLVVVGISVAACALAQLLAEPVLVLVFGEEFRSATGVFRWLLLAGVFLNGKSMLLIGLRGLNRPGKVLLAELPAAAVTILVLIYLLPVLGIAAAGLASLLAYFLAMLIALLLLYRVQPNLNEQDKNESPSESD